MLELRNLVKSYTTAGFTQKALDDVSVTLRDNEFVAVLGPSGSGKTTLLNIVGGLDHYDSGDLVIDGISTKSYKDRDWDTYRNNRIGFVFQSYNLIPHQTVLSNVELALTLSGVPKSERKERARQALAMVGLEEHISKKPSQLSGGQMQRVAIARALINDPEILLADEPTGALDSKTSVQIMDLLKDIAADRLVVMVTHNPELADEYANRVIKLSDGKVVDDTNPVLRHEQAHEGRPPRRAKMSFLTAIALSFSNLMTKKGRTLMMAFAGSIGIVGIAGIMALSNGVNNYIKTVEEDTLSVYPLSITSTGFDMTSLLVGSSMSGDDSSSDEEEDNASAQSSSSSSGAANEDSLREMPVISSMFDTVNSNDLASLKTYLEGDESNIMQYVNTIQYAYDVTPQIYLPATEPEVHQVHPDSSFSVLGMGSGMSSSSLMSMGMSTDVFGELMTDYELYSEQYEVLAGDWPQKDDEILLVLASSRRITDIMLYPMGLKDYRELNSMVEAFVNEEEVVTTDSRLNFTYKQILDVDFKLVYNSDFYTHDANYDVWVDRKDDVEFVKELVAKGKDLHICGIVAPKDDSSTLMLSPGLYYTQELTRDIVGHSKTSEVTKYQLANPTLNIFTNKTFIEEANESKSSEFDMENLFEIDEDAMAEAFKMDLDTSAMGELDMSSLMSSEDMLSGMEDMDFSEAFSEMDLGLGDAQMEMPDMSVALNGAMQAAMGAIIQNYPTWLAANGTGVAEADFAAYMQSPEVQTIMGSTMAGIASAIDIEGQMAEYSAQIEEALAVAMEEVITEIMTEMMTAMGEQIGASLETAMTDLFANMSDAMSIDEEAFAAAFKFNLDESELTALMLSMMGGQESSMDGNLRKLGFADFDKPFRISLYPFDFEGKQHILDILDDYNKRMEDAGNDEKVITYTDIVGTLMSSVTEIIDMISMVLVAFVAISLVVSSIMIGVITYISVLERKKEIGILRSIGASKGDIGRVFNAETLIVGFVAGAMGIGIVLIAAIPINIIIMQIFDIPNLVLLPPIAAVVLIGVSCVLTFVAGLFPSSAASRKDPVEALRSE